jgi:hypothetical protein
MKIYLNAYLILKLDRDVWSDSSAGGIIPEAAAFRVHWIREWMGPRVGLVLSEKRKISYSFQ